MDTRQCTGTSVAGYCPGAITIQCCVTGTGSPSPPTPGVTVPPTSPPSPTAALGSFKGVDVAGTVSASVFNCLKSSGYDYAIVRAWHSNGVADTSACTSIQRAHAAGMASVDVYMFPCPLCSASAGTQMANMVTALANAGCTNVAGAQGSTNYGLVWFDIEQPSYWSSQSFNQAFFNGLVTACASTSQTCGVYTGLSQWVPIMGSNFNAGSSMPLWYAHYDAKPAFSDFASFAGWTTPFMKQFQGDQTVCGFGIDENWTPHPQPKAGPTFGSTKNQPTAASPTATAVVTQASAATTSFVISGVLILAPAFIV